MQPRGGDHRGAASVNPDRNELMSAAGCGAAEAKPVDTASMPATRSKRHTRSTISQPLRGDQRYQIFSDTCRSADRSQSKLTVNHLRTGRLIYLRKPEAKDKSPPLTRDGVPLPCDNHQVPAVTIERYVDVPGQFALFHLHRATKFQMAWFTWRECERIG
jgi:hypothetical protein